MKSGPTHRRGRGSYWWRTEMAKALAPVDRIGRGHSLSSRYWPGTFRTLSSCRLSWQSGRIEVDAVIPILQETEAQWDEAVGPSHTLPVNRQLGCPHPGMSFLLLQGRSWQGPSLQHRSPSKLFIPCAAGREGSPRVKDSKVTPG